MLTYDEIKSFLTSIDRLDILAGSAVYNDRLSKIISSLDQDISTAIEIGTYRGLSTSVIASFGIYVHTFDVAFQKDTELIWKKFGCSKMINYHLSSFCRNEEIFNLNCEETDKIFYDGDFYVNEIRGWNKTIIKDLDFQFAFIDGRHTYEDVKLDFEMVSRCGLVLFHDNRDSFPGVKKFVKEIGAESIGEFALYCNCMCI